MALTRPILNNITPFDATQEHVVTFTASGSGSQITGNRLIIKRNDTLATVYDNTQTTFGYSHTIPANTLQNGVNYIANLIAISGTEQSPESRAQSFICLATPTFRFTNIPQNNVIDNNSFQFMLEYNQTNGEPLNSVVFNLYSQTGALLSTSGNINNFGSNPVTVPYLFSGFNENQIYYIEANGETLHGMVITTGQIKFSVIYDSTSVYNDLVVTNNCKGGYINISSSITAIGASSVPENPVYPNNDSIDLTGDGSYVNFQGGYEINGDFTLKMWGTNFTIDSQIIQLSNLDDNIIRVRYLQDGANNVIAKLDVYDFAYHYQAYSNSIPIPSNTDQLYIMLRRISNVYQITLVNRGVGA